MKSFLDKLDYVRYNNKWMLCVNSSSSYAQYISIRSLGLQITFETSRYGNLDILPDENLKIIYEKLKELNFEFSNSNTLELYSLKIFFDNIEQFNLLKEWLEIYLMTIKLSYKKGANS